MQIADVAYNRPLKNSLGQHHMHSIIEAAGQQLDSGTPVQDVDVRYIFGGVAIICGQRCQNNMWPKVFDWLLKAYGALSEVNVQSALDQIGYSNCWPSGDGYCTPFQSAFLTVKELFNCAKGSPVNTEEPVLVGELSDVQPEDNVNLEFESLALALERGLVEEGQEPFWGEVDETPMDR